MTIIQKIVKAKDLPPEWGKAFADPEVKVEVSITEYDEELNDAKDPIEGLDIISRHAEARGRTPEIADEITSERSAAL